MLNRERIEMPRTIGAVPRPCACGALVGDTPLLALDMMFRGQACTVYGKAEFLNPTGSIKDRMAHRILTAAAASGALRPGQRVVEATSGNAGIALAAMGAARGHPVTIFMPDWMSAERRALLASFGAELRLVSHEDGGFLGSIAQAEAFAAKNDAFLARQFENDDNWRAHAETTMPELVRQMGGAPDAIVAGVGTGGTIMGAARHVSEMGFATRCHPVEPAESPTLSTGYKVGRHRIQGVSDEFIPAIVRLDELADIIAVPDGDAIIMAQMLSRKLGLGVGISSGANVLAALQLIDRYGPDYRVATVLCDNSARYLSTDYAKVEPVRDGYLSSVTELNCARRL